MLVCRDCEEDFDPNDRFWDFTFPKRPIQRKHGEVGYRNQCGDCGLNDDNPAVDRVRALEEGDGTKASCEVTPISPLALSGDARRYYQTFGQRYQPIGLKK
tara:strand:+ start:7115 stop:7417 length:303 start_codon:yes stop_codon:yes gene_type:complete